MSKKISNPPAPDFSKRPPPPPPPPPRLIYDGISVGLCSKCSKKWSKR
jgi:hypothetical protein